MVKLFGIVLVALLAWAVFFAVLFRAPKASPQLLLGLAGAAGLLTALSCGSLLGVLVR